MLRQKVTTWCWSIQRAECKTMCPLMKALSKLVVENEPNLVLFVCEALVGNDGIDQLTMFNRARSDARQIDGIILTKFDTVSDKVGAALTMTHVTGAPVVRQWGPGKSTII